jgi:hypothetical protein
MSNDQHDAGGVVHEVGLELTVLAIATTIGSDGDGDGWQMHRPPRHEVLSESLGQVSKKLDARD